MGHARSQAVIGLIALLSIPSLVWAQNADNSREKTEKVSEILAALQAEPGSGSRTSAQARVSIRFASLELSVRQVA